MDSKRDKICRIFTILLLLIYLRSATATNINCGGKPFHCVNSTHFMICVDLGAGVTKTVDDFVIHCPPTTSCSANNRFECEYQLPTTTEMIIRLSDETNDSKIDIQSTWNDITNTVIPLQKTSNTRLLNEYYNTIDVSTHADYVPEKQGPQQREISGNSEIINNSNNKSSVRNQHLNYLTTTSEKYIGESSLDNTILDSTNSLRLLVPSEDDTFYLQDSTLSFSTKSDQVLGENSFAPNITKDITSETNISKKIILNGDVSFTTSMNISLYDTTATISTDASTLMAQEVITTDFQVKTNHYDASLQIENRKELTPNFDTIGIAKGIVNTTSSHNELNTFINDSFQILSSVLEPTVTENVRGTTETIGSTKVSSNNLNDNEMFLLQYETEISPEVKFTSTGRNPISLVNNIVNDINYKSTSENVSAPSELILRSKTIQEIVTESTLIPSTENDLKIILSDAPNTFEVPPTITTDSNYYIENTASIEYSTTTSKSDLLEQIIQHSKVRTLSPVEKASPEDIHTTNTDTRNLSLVSIFLLSNDNLTTLSSLSISQPEVTSTEHVTYNKEDKENTYEFRYNENKNKMLEFENAREISPETEDTTNSIHTIGYHISGTNKSATTEINVTSSFVNDNFTLTTVELNVIDQNIQEKASENSRILFTKDSKLSPEEVNTLQMPPSIVTENPFFKLENKTKITEVVISQIIINDKVNTLPPQGQNMSKVKHPEDISTTNAYILDSLVKTEFLYDTKEVIDSNTTVISNGVYENKLLQYENSTELPREVGATSKSLDSIPLGHVFYTERSVTTEMNMISVFDNNNLTHKLTTTAEPQDEKTMQVTPTIVTESPYSDDSSLKLENKTRTSEVNIRKSIQIDNRDTTLYPHELYKSKVTLSEDVSTMNANTRSSLVKTQFSVSNDNFTTLSSLPTLDVYENEMLQYENPTELPPEVGATSKSFDSIPVGHHVFYTSRLANTETNIIPVFDNDNLTYEIMTTVELLPQNEKTIQKTPTIVTKSSDDSSSNLENKTIALEVNLREQIQIGNQVNTLSLHEPYNLSKAALLEDKSTTNANTRSSLVKTKFFLPNGNFTTLSSFPTLGQAVTHTEHVTNKQDVIDSTTVISNDVMSSLHYLNPFFFDNYTVSNDITTVEVMAQEENTVQEIPSIVTENPYFDGVSSKLKNNTTSELNLMELINTKRGALSSPGQYISKTTLPGDIATTNDKPPKTLVNTEFFSSDNFTTLSSLHILEPAVTPVKHVIDRKVIESITDARNNRNESKTFWLKYENARKMPLRLRNESVDPEMMSEATSNTISKLEIKHAELLNQASVPSSDLTTDSTFDVQVGHSTIIGWQDVIFTSTEAPTIIENNTVNLISLITVDSAYNNYEPSDITKGMTTTSSTSNESNTIFTLQHLQRKMVTPTVVNKLPIGNAVRNHVKNVPNELNIDEIITEPIIDDTYTDRWALSNTMSFFSPDLTTTETSKWRGGIEGDYPPSTELLVTNDMNMPYAPQLFTPNLVSKMGETLSTYNEITTEDTTKYEYYDLLSIENQNPFVFIFANKNISTNSNAVELEPVSSQNISELYFSSKINKSIHDENNHQEIQNYITDTAFTVGLEGTAKTLSEQILVNETEQNFITTVTPTPNVLVDFIKKQLNVPSQNITIQYSHENNSVKDKNTLNNGDKKYASNITVDETNKILESIKNTDNPSTIREDYVQVSDKSVISNQPTVTMVPMLHSDGILLRTIETNNTPENVVTINNNISFTQLNTTDEERISNKRSVLVNTEATSHGTQLKIKKSNNFNMNRFIIINNKENTPLEEKATLEFTTQRGISTSSSNTDRNTSNSQLGTGGTGDINLKTNETFQIGDKPDTVKKTDKDKNIFGIHPKPSTTSIVNKIILAKTNLEDRKLPNTVSVGIKVNQSSVNVAVFTCKNRLRGRYSDKNDCRKFYICIGKVQPLHGECPANTVFSEIKKQCTKNLSHCFRNNQFHCIQEGRFSDVLRSNVYYICLNHTSTYIRLQFQCHNGYHLNKTSIQCVTDMKFQSRVSSKSVDNDSKKGSDQSTVEKKSKEKKQVEDEEKHICRDEGKFADADDCRKYYVCSKTSKSGFRRRIKKCDSDEVFHREKKKCVDSESYECK